MAQLESNKGIAPSEKITLPARKFTMELLVGVFALVGCLCAGLLAVGLGRQTLFGGGETEIFAEFDNVAGLEKGASVEIGGVPVGSVTNIGFKDPVARVTLRLFPGVQIKDDDIAAIRTKGIIGDRYVKISRGGSSVTIPPGGRMTETESVVDIEDIIGKIVHSLTGDKKEEGKKE